MHPRSREKIMKYVAKYSINLICFILVTHTNNIIKDQITPSSTTVEVITNTLTYFGPYRPSSEGQRYCLETTITMGVLNVKIYTHTLFVMHNIYKIQTFTTTAAVLVSKIFKTFVI
jgi:hypothetical protein